MNKTAIVTLDNIAPKKDNFGQMDLVRYEGKLRKICDDTDTEFIDYDSDRQQWIFKVTLSLPLSLPLVWCGLDWFGSLRLLDVISFTSHIII